MANRARPQTIVVIGLGRFGAALAEELHDEGHEVMGIDSDPHLVDAAVGHLTYAEVADATEADALRQLGVGEVQHAVVAIGEALQASILSTAGLSDIGVTDIWARAQNDQHRRILERVGAHHTVFPERDMGVRVAHRITGRLVDFLSLGDGMVAVETTVPEHLDGRRLDDTGLREDLGITVVCHKPPGGTFAAVGPDCVLHTGDPVVVIGPEDAADRFADGH